MSDIYTPILLEFHAIDMGSTSPVIAFRNNSSPPFSVTRYAPKSLSSEHYGWIAQYTQSSGNVKMWSSAANSIDTLPLRTVTFTSKLAEVTDGDAFLEWLNANATKQ